ncbi:C-type lectin domain family 4 member E-like protein [Labeo rohita]|uniref:C-type lectin domain family 4 member E-like protein n=1 Tax=Labeo rohita TaxID=84645 RepID=A0A498NUG6_LABRO|nr:C-type lectin domain family 4 member E-like protein [Labeo rohita]
MDLVYYNDDMPSTTTSDRTQYRVMAIELEELTANYTRVKEHLRINNSYNTKVQESERKVYPPKWKKVLLIAFAVCISLALGGLCILGILYVSASVQLSAQETNGTIMVRKSEELKANYTKVREQLSFYEAFKAQSLNCDMTSTTFKGKLYFFSCDKLNWLCSRAFCVSKGADLVTITSQTEQRFLLSKIKDWNWIGLNDLETEGHWVWVNNQTLNETGVQCISRMLNVPVSTVGAIIRKWKEHQFTINRPRSGAPRKKPVRGVQRIIRRVLQEPRTTQAELQEDLASAGNSTDEQESEMKVCPPKRTKVLLIVFAVCLVFALGGLCILGTLLNNHKMNSDYENVVYLPSATASGGKCSQYRDKNTLANFESLNKKHVMVSMQLSAQEKNGTAMKKEFNDLTARYNSLKERLSFFKAQSCNLSVDGWIACRGKLYLFSSDKLNWSRSREDVLVSKIKQTHWIGLNDLETEGRWVWVNNQTLTETKVQFWFSEKQREPDNWSKQDPSGENCASLGDDNGNFQSWFDASCKKKKKFICEKKYRFTPISDSN